MNRIVFEIEKQIWDSVSTENRIGVLNGLSGIALFYNYLIAIDDNEEYQNKLISIIERIDNLISENEYINSFCSGLAGYGWVLLKIKNENIDVDDDYLYNIDILLSKTLLENSTQNDYDFLHGGLGIAMYFIERYKFKKDQKIKDILMEFSNSIIDKINDNIETVFLNDFEKSNQKCFHFGLAHGISGFLNFFIHLQSIFEETSQDVKLVIKKIVDFIFKFKKYDEESKQFYPSHFMIEENVMRKSRLGWCQGDLGIGISIYNAGFFLDDKEVQQEGIKLINATKNITLNDSCVNDFAICHGSSGIILQYYLVAKKLDQDYTESIDIWLENLKNQTHNFVVFNSFMINKYINETNILNGSSGLGLVLLTLEGKIDIDWIECLNLY